MNPETEQALEASIAHWNRHATGTAAPGETVFGHDCALCDRFVNDNDDEMCTVPATGERCPVMIKTEESNCYRTPWRAAANAYGKEEFPARAAEMRDFLIALRGIE